MEPTQDHPQRQPALRPDEARLLDALLEAHWQAAAGGQVDPASYERTDAGFKLRAVAADPPADPISTELVNPQAAEASAPGDAARRRRAAQWLALVGQCPAADPPEDLVRRTVQYVEETRERERLLLHSQAGGGGRGFNVRWAELGTVAALLLIGVSLLWPVLHRTGEDARRIACEANLLLAGQAMGRYAGDYAGVLPRRLAEPGTVWWNVGAPTHEREPVQSNSAHLYQLVRHGYLTAEDLACPANPQAPAPGVMTASLHDWPEAQAASYSYQNQHTPQPMRLNGPGVSAMALLADKNPLFAARAEGRRLIHAAGLATASSPLHGRQGQNVLFGDGRTRWMRESVLDNGDKIWLAEGIEQYTGRELPTSPIDSFLVP